MVALSGLAKAYREGDSWRLIFQDLHFRQDRGTVTALLGRSGCGKSTLLNLISGIDLPDAGEVRVAGEPLNRLSERARTLFRRHHIGFVFQFFNLIPTLTVEENLLLPLELRGQSGPAARRQVHALLQQVGLEGRADSYPERLSGGEQQRVAVARALVHEPDLVLADEPTGNLDQETGQEVMALLDRLIHQRGGTLLVVTHSAEVAALADAVYALRDGALVAQGWG